MDDVFIALDKIYKDLPKKKIIIRDIRNINYGDIIKSPLIIPSNIPPYNQASMDGIGVKIKRKDYFMKGKPPTIAFHQEFSENHQKSA